MENMNTDCLHLTVDISVAGEAWCSVCGAYRNPKGNGDGDWLDRRGLAPGQPGGRNLDRKSNSARERVRY